MKIQLKKQQAGIYKAELSNGHKITISRYENKWYGDIDDENGETEATINGTSKKDAVNQINNYYGV